MTDNASLFRLDGRVAFVTGGASGIGQAIAEGIAEMGADVAIVDLPGTDAADSLERVRKHGRQAVHVAADVTDPDQINDAVLRVEADLGPPTLAVNSAGIVNVGPAETMSLEQFEKVYRVNVTGVFLSCKAEAKGMMRHGGGSIVNIASMSGRISHWQMFQAHYNSSKAAVAHLSKSLATEWASRGIRVNSLSPGFTLTPMNRRPEIASIRAEVSRHTPLGRFAEPEELAGPAVFLLSDAARFCTGVDLLVDGGFSCW